MPFLTSQASSVGYGRAQQVSSSASVTFSQTFNQSSAPSVAVQNAWTTFRLALTGVYTRFVWSSTTGQSITVTDATGVQAIANALRTATTGTNFSQTIGANTWRVVNGCVAGTVTANAIEFTNASGCTCSVSYTIRPFINNANWGATNASSCGAVTQTITITFS